MKDEHAQFSGYIPASYDRYLGPMLFQPYADDLAACWLRDSKTDGRLVETLSTAEDRFCDDEAHAVFWSS
jgi:hypothetical protein